VKLRNRILAGFVIVLAVAVTVLAVMLSHDKPCTPPPAAAPGAATMQAVSYTCYGGPEVLTVAPIEKPAPAAGEVLVRVRKAGVNPLDWHFMRGEPYFMRLASGLGAPERPGLGVDFAGTVEAVGTGVTRFRPGDAVFGGQFGAFADYLILDAEGSLVPSPDDLDVEQAAGVPIAALTALQALRDKGHVHPGQKVLINGASGQLRTVIDRHYALDEIAEAIRYSESGRARGKIIIDVAD
jgi:NADPH:quinone reductase-like Zn-dependent oxidoreductase